jgi:FixJ family two-component response regulator
MSDRLPGSETVDFVVYIVDDDEAVRRALGRLVRSLGIRTEAFASSEELLEHGLDEETACLLLDVQLPGIDGIALHERVLETGHRLPAIFITAHPDERSRARAHELDAVAYLEKPVDEELLLAALERALTRIAVASRLKAVTRPAAAPRAGGRPAPGRSPRGRPPR